MSIFWGVSEETGMIGDYVPWPWGVLFKFPPSLLWKNSPEVEAAFLTFTSLPFETVSQSGFCTRPTSLHVSKGDIDGLEEYPSCSEQVPSLIPSKRLNWKDYYCLPVSYSGQISPYNDLNFSKDIQAKTFKQREVIFFFWLLPVLLFEG